MKTVLDNEGNPIEIRTLSDAIEESRNPTESDASVRQREEALAAFQASIAGLSVGDRAVIAGLAGQLRKVGAAYGELGYIAISLVAMEMAAVRKDYGA